MSCCSEVNMPAVAVVVTIYVLLGLFSPYYLVQSHVTTPFFITLCYVHLHDLCVLAVGAFRKDFHTVQAVLWDHPGLQLCTHAVTVVAFSKRLYS